MFKKDRKDFESKWEDLKIFVQYGMLSDDKFADKAKSFSLLKNTEGTYFTIEEYKEKIEALQKDKDGKTVCLYTNNAEEQFSFVKKAKDRGYDVLHLDGPLLIVAGAGSGKTKVLTSRIANIIKEKKAFPNQILAVTFTNKAAKEMQNRVSKILGSTAAKSSETTNSLQSNRTSPSLVPLAILYQHFLGAQMPWNLLTTVWACTRRCTKLTELTTQRMMSGTREQTLQHHQKEGEEKEISP